MMNDRAAHVRRDSLTVEAGGVVFHVEVSGEGPALLLLHGTGASAHSWHAAAKRLAGRFTVIMPDLPGHGRSTRTDRAALTLPGMARAIAALLDTLGHRPQIAVGHSAGAAVVIRMALDGLLTPRLIISVNGALLPFQGPAGQFFAPLAKLLMLNPFAPRLFAWSAQDRAKVKRLLDDTGSTLDDSGIDSYAALFRNPAHVAGALAMMANWDLKQLERDLPRLKTRLVLIAASNDRSIAPDYAFRVRDMVPGSRVELVRGLGHLAHEERPDEIAELILRIVESETGH